MSDEINNNNNGVDPNQQPEAAGAQPNETTYDPNAMQQPAPVEGKKDKPRRGLNLIGFCIPLVGIILFFVWRGEQPKAAKSMIIWTLIGLVLYGAFLGFLGWLGILSMFF